MTIRVTQRLTHMVIGASLRLQFCAAEPWAAPRAGAQERSLATLSTIRCLLDDPPCGSGKLPAQPRDCALPLTPGDLQRR